MGGHERYRIGRGEPEREREYTYRLSGIRNGKFLAGFNQDTRTINGGNGPASGGDNQIVTVVFLARRRKRKRAAAKDATAGIRESRLRHGTVSY